MTCAKPQRALFTLPPRAKRVVGRVGAKGAGVGGSLQTNIAPHPKPMLRIGVLDVKKRRPKAAYALPTAPLRFAGGGEIARAVT
jgi:hypothetical protein